MPRKDSGEPVWGQGELDLGRVPVGRAKICPLPESEPGLTGNVAASGVNTSEPFAHFDHATSSWKTYQVCLLTNTWDVFSETWPRAGTMRSGRCFQRAPLMRHTEEIVSGLWPTPTANQSISCTMRAAWKEAKRLHPLGRWTIATVIAEEVGPSDGHLNPQWIEWLMGYPIGFTALEDSATPSSRKSRNGSDGKS